MGGEGSMSGAITSLKNNRGSLRSKRGGMKSDHLNYSTSGKLEFKEVSPEELEKIKKEIQQKSLRDRKRRRRIFVCCILLITIPIILFMSV